MRDVLKNNFDKLLLSFFLLLFTGIAIFIFKHDSDDTKAFDWMSHAFAEFQGALLGLITGVAIGRSLANSEKKEKE